MMVIPNFQTITGIRFNEMCQKIPAETVPNNPTTMSNTKKNRRDSFVTSLNRRDQITIK